VLRRLAIIDAAQRVGFALDEVGDLLADRGDACVEACPVDACFAEDQLPSEWQQNIQINADYYQNGA
jgi:DNA-binding transcriptional MerR regulator